MKSLLRALGVAVLCALLVACPDEDQVPDAPVVVQMSYRAGYPPYGWRYPYNYPAELTLTPPSSVTTLPSGDAVYYGELSFTGGVTIVFAVTMPNDGANATFYVDHDRNGDLTDDTPAFYEGTGTEGTALLFSVSFPRTDGSDEPYQIWLWTSLRAGTPHYSESDPAGFNFYARCYKEGVLTVRTDSGAEELPVVVWDQARDGSYAVDNVTVDWNRNGDQEDADVVTVGAPMYYRGLLITAAEVASHADSVTFEIQACDGCPAEAFDVEEDLALQPIVGNPPPPLDVQDIDGNLIRWGDYEGRVVLLDFWATWCAYCVDELPNVLSVYDTYHAQGFDVIGVSLDSSLSQLRSYIQGNGIPWPQICDGLGWAGAIPTRYRIEGIPAPILVGRSGLIVSLNARGSALQTLVAGEIAK